MSFGNTPGRRVWDWLDWQNQELLPQGVAVISVLLVIESVLFVAIPAAESYETSVVTAFPVSFWALFYAVLLGGVLVMILSALTGESYWRHGLLLVLANYAIYFFLPVARGYKLYGRGDILRHLGDVQGILQTGTLPGNWYPGTHVLMSELVMLGVPLDNVRYLVAFLLTGLHIVGLGVLIRVLSGRQAGMGIGLAVATPLVYTELHLSTQPAMVSFLLLPVVATVMEMYRRSRRPVYLCFMMVLGTFMVYTHPLTTVFLTILIAAGAGYSLLHKQFFASKLRRLSPRLAAIFPMLLFTWIINFEQTRIELRKVLTPNQEASPSAATIQEASGISFTVFQLASKFLQLYGTVAIYGGTAAVSALYVLKQILQGDLDYNWGLSGAQFSLGVGITAAFVLNSLIIGNIIRGSRYMLLFAVVIIGLALVNRVMAGDKYVTGLLVLIVLATAIVGVNAAYEPNRQVTYSEYDGNQFLLEHADGSYIYNANTDNRMEEFVLGDGSPRIYPEQMSNSQPVPRRLGYESEQSTAGGTFGESMLVTKDLDTRQHTAQYYTQEQQELLYLYGQEDVQRLGDDTTANKVYTNGGYDGWDINPNS